MKIIADTNLLVRLITSDDRMQSDRAREAMEIADAAMISIHSLCELAWVLRSQYSMPRPDIAAAVRHLVGTAGVVVDRPIVDAGLAMLGAGGDFADGVIAHDGRWLGGETFVSFDAQAIKLLKERGVAAEVLV